MLRWKTAFTCLFLILLSAFSYAADKPAHPEKRLIVGIKEVPPFVIKNETGNWTGISIALWEQIASDLELSFEFREMDLDGLLKGVSDGSLDAAVAAITITWEREEHFDFTHPFYSTGLGIAIPTKKGGAWYSVIKRFASMAFFKVVATLTLVLFGVGALVWWLERRKNPSQFGGGTTRGVGSGFWWSAVTMTTVGYGDKAPVTTGGRVVALIWMFVSVIIISTFTAAITSSLTVSKLESAVKGPQDLINVRVGSIAGTTSAGYLTDNHVSFKEFKTPVEGLAALAGGEIDAFVYDEPLIRYLIHTMFRTKLEVLPHIFEWQNYGIALPHDSPLREPINRILLKKIKGRPWQDILYKYLGQK